MEKERLESILKSHKAITNIKWIKENEYGFSRNIEFTIRGQRYEILWYINCSELFCGELQVCSFVYIGIDGCYPNGYKENLVFSIPNNNSLSGRKTIALIPLEEYD